MSIAFPFPVRKDKYAFNNKIIKYLFVHAALCISLIWALSRLSEVCANSPLVVTLTYHTKQCMNCHTNQTLGLTERDIFIEWPLNINHFDNSITRCF